MNYSIIDVCRKISEEIESSEVFSRHGGIDYSDLAKSDSLVEFLERFESLKEDDQTSDHIQFNDHSKERILSSLTDAAAGTIDYYFRRDHDARLDCIIKLTKIYGSLILVTFEAESDLGSSRLYFDSNLNGDHEAYDVLDSQIWNGKEIIDMIEHCFECNSIEAFRQLLDHGDEIRLELQVDRDEALRLIEMEDEDSINRIIVDSVRDQFFCIENLCLISGSKAGFEDFTKKDLSNEAKVAFILDLDKI